jgi:hypothetical protein
LPGGILSCDNSFAEKTEESPLSSPEETLRKEALRLLEAADPGSPLLRFVYHGSCMNPVLRENDILLVRPVSPQSLRRGDIIVYRSRGTCWVHRFLSLRKTTDDSLSIIAKADNRSFCDAPFPGDLLLGRVVEIRRHKQRFNLEQKKVIVLFSLLARASAAEAAALCFFRRRRNSVLGKTLLIQKPLSPRRSAGIRELLHLPQTVLHILFNGKNAFSPPTQSIQGVFSAGDRLNHRRS